MFTLATVMGTELTKADTSVEWLESAMEELLDLGRARGKVSKQGGRVVANQARTAGATRGVARAGGNSEEEGRARGLVTNTVASP